jgi:sporulation protein YlmC with PRC-barrel domain
MALKSISLLNCKIRALCWSKWLWSLALLLSNLTSLSATATASTDTLGEVNELLGVSIVNAHGEELGTLTNLAVDWQTGRVSYAVLSFGGVFGGLPDIEARMFAVPIDALTLLTEAATMRMDLDKETIIEAVGLDDNDWSILPDQEENTASGRVFAWDELIPNKANEPIIGFSTAAYMLSQSTSSLQKVTDLMGLEVKDIQGETLGKSEDLIIDWPARKLVYAIVSTGGMMGSAGETDFKIPREAITLVARPALAAPRFAKDSYFQLKVGREQFEKSTGQDASP